MVRFTIRLFISPRYDSIQKWGVDTMETGARHRSRATRAIASSAAPLSRSATSRWSEARDAWHAIEIGVVPSQASQAVVLHEPHDQSVVDE